MKLHYCVPPLHINEEAQMAICEGLWVQKLNFCHSDVTNVSVCSGTGLKNSDISVE
jgi:hypothetical protein